jgi:hypothetical protein
MVTVIAVPTRTTEGKRSVQRVPTVSYNTPTQRGSEDPYPQGVQDASPPIEYVPAGHAVHNVEPAVEYVLFAHVVQDDEFVLKAYVPAAQGVHAAEPGAAAVPGLHVLHPEVPPVELVPPGQMFNTAPLTE